LQAIFFIDSGSCSANRSATLTLRALAMRFMFSADGKRRLISILPIKVMEQPMVSARAIWEMPSISRYFFIFRANKRRQSFIKASIRDTLLSLLRALNNNNRYVYILQHIGYNHFMKHKISVLFV